MAAYPRKQTLFIFIICALLVGGVAFYVYGQKSNHSASSASVQTLSDAISEDFISANTDWQKQFLNSATSSAFKTPSKAIVATEDKPLTATDKLNEGFFKKYAELSKAGLTSDPKVSASVMSQVVSSVTDSLPLPDAYDLTDIHSVSANDKQSLSDYQKKILSIFKTYLPDTNEVVIAQQAYEDNDMTVLEKIDPVISNYKNIVSGLLKVTVPSALAGKHLELINGFRIAQYNAESLRHMDTDPVQGLSAISMEVGNMQNIAAAANSIQSYLTAAGILAIKI